MRVLVTGARGQIGSELVVALRARYGTDAVLSSDVRAFDNPNDAQGPFQLLDCTDPQALAEVVAGHQPDTIYHLAAILSAVGEANPQRAYAINVGTLMNVLEVARTHECSVFTPSSIAAFGPDTPADPTPQDTIQRPTTMYGVTKVAGELLCDYYRRRFGVDVRGVRYPGLISHQTAPGGGTTDYAVDIFHQAVSQAKYTCFLANDTQLDMMYMPDAIRAAIELMEADPNRLRHWNAFNIAAMQFTPETLSAEIRKHIPHFEIAYDVDPLRQAIAESWPRRVDDSAARQEWGWDPEFDLARMTEDMIANLERV